MAEGAIASFSHIEINKTSKQAKDVQAELFLPHLEDESVLLPH